MTLIAGFRAYGFPVLLGDFLITDNAKKPTDLKKKVHKISKNCAAAWTGDFIAASLVIRNLKQQFNLDYISYKEIELHLTKYNPEEFGKRNSAIWNFSKDD